VCRPEGRRILSYGALVHSPPTPLEVLARLPTKLLYNTSSARGLRRSASSRSAGSQKLPEQLFVGGAERRDGRVALGAAPGGCARPRTAPLPGAGAPSHPSATVA